MLDWSIQDILYNLKSRDTGKTRKLFRNLLTYFSLFCTNSSPVSVPLLSVILTLWGAPISVDKSTRYFTSTPFSVACNETLYGFETSVPRQNTEPVVIHSKTICSLWLCWYLFICQLYGTIININLLMKLIVVSQ